MENKRFLNVDDVAGYMDVSVPTAYKIIRRMNNDLQKQGYIVVAGKVSRAYFEKKVYGSAICD